MRVDISLGVGAWTVYKTVDLIACPRAGDLITLDGSDTLTADTVFIGTDRVYVRCRHWFEREEDLAPYVAAGWSR